jgi:glucose/arabinose dehydrogenase
MRTLSVSVLTVLMVVSMATTALAQLPPGGTFVDDDGNVHEGFIEAIATEKITLGCNPPINDRYCPSSLVTRGEMAAFLVRAFDLTDDGGRDWFGDDGTSNFEADINKLATAGITRGCNPPANDQFCPNGRVTREQMAAFLVRAYDYSDASTDDYFTDDEDSLFEADINNLAAAGITRGCNPPANDHYCPTQDVRRDEMASFLGRAEGLTPLVPPARVVPDVEVVVSGLDDPLLATSPAGDDRLFVVEKSGYIQILDNDALVGKPFLDIHDLVSAGSEQGLLGMAFHPDHASNGLLYVSYTDKSGDSRIVEYEVSTNPNVVDESTARLILRVDQPYSNHNGGMVAFDPSGMLLVSLGDGGGGGDPDENGQKTSTLLAALLRLDIDGDDFPTDSARNYAIPSDNPFVGKAGADEVWVYGLRNPWRFSIDVPTGLLYIGDVGQGQWEEIDVAPATMGGLNFGWNSFEGEHCYDTADGCDRVGKTFPALEYSHAQGCSVTGGYVYRGTEFPDLVGHYFFADYCRGELRSFLYQNGVVSLERNWTTEVGSLGSVIGFGVDNDERLYILNTAGAVMRLAPATP